MKALMHHLANLCEVVRARGHGPARALGAGLYPPFQSRPSKPEKNPCRSSWSSSSCVRLVIRARVATPVAAAAFTGSGLKGSRALWIHPLCSAAASKQNKQQKQQHRTKHHRNLANRARNRTWRGQSIMKKVLGSYSCGESNSKGRTALRGSMHHRFIAPPIPPTPETCFHWLSLVFQWFSLFLHWFSLVFHWFSLVFHGFHCIFIGFHTFFIGFAMISHGLSTTCYVIPDNSTLFSLKLSTKSKNTHIFPSFSNGASL